MNITRFYSKGLKRALMCTQCIPQKTYAVKVFTFQIEVPEAGDL